MKYTYTMSILNRILAHRENYEFDSVELSPHDYRQVLAEAKNTLALSMRIVEGVDYFIYHGITFNLTPGLRDTE